MSNYHYSNNVYRWKLREPKEVKQYANAMREEYIGKCCGKEYVNYIQEYHNKLILRTFAIRVRKNGETKYTEICRRLYNQNPVFCNCNFYYVGGWVVDYSNKWNEELSWAGWNKSIGWFYGKFINKDEILTKYDLHHTYTYKTNMNIFEYIGKLQEQPALELLIKNGYPELARSINLLDKKARTIEGVLKVDKKWTEYLKGKGRHHLLACRLPFIKTKEDVEEYLSLQRNWVYRRYMKTIGKYFREATEYEEKQKDFYVYYSDYISIAKKLGYPLNEKKWLFPKNLKKAHDEAVNKYQTIKNKKVDDGIKKNAKKLSKYIFESEKYLIRPAQSTQELISESKELNHCVRTYADKYSKGITAIFFIRTIKKPDKSLATLELQGKKVIQVRANNNSNPNKNIKEFLQSWATTNNLKYL